MSLSAALPVSNCRICIWLPISVRDRSCSSVIRIPPDAARSSLDQLVVDARTRYLSRDPGHQGLSHDLFTAPHASPRVPEITDPEAVIPSLNLSHPLSACSKPAAANCSNKRTLWRFPTRLFAAGHERMTLNEGRSATLQAGGHGFDLVGSTPLAPHRDLSGPDSKHGQEPNDSPSGLGRP
jgi:hypothetical protein